MTNPETLRECLVEANLERVADALVKLAEPCIAIEATENWEEEMRIGVSRFGGKPDLPPGFQWPYRENVPLAFLGQINLAELAKNPIAAKLPSVGLLSFFCDSENRSWGFDPKHRSGWAVHLFTLQDLQPTPIPEEFPDHEGYVACDLKFKDSLTLPGIDSPAIKALQLTEEEQVSYFRLSVRGGVNSHHLLGLPQEIQGPMQLVCQLASHGINCGYKIDYQTSEIKALLPGIDDWVLLLQIDTDDKPDWIWCDCGRLYFWITKADLSAARFDRVWMKLQSY